MNELDKAVAELLGWSDSTGNGKWADSYGYIRHFGPFTPSTDANQAQAAVREWCGEYASRQLRYTAALFNQVDKDGKRQFQMIGKRQFQMITATPEQLCRALLAAAKESQ